MDFFKKPDGGLTKPAIKMSWHGISYFLICPIKYKLK
jgi:hypothetical protein